MSAADRSIFLPGGPTGVLLAHGLGGTPTELKNVARGLNAAGYTVLSCQLAGHCGSEQDLRLSTAAEWRASVDAGFARLRETCANIYAGGLSMGALMAIDFAARRPGAIDGLLLYAPTLKHDGWAIPWYSFLLDILIDTPIGRAYRFVERWPYGLKDERVREVVLRAMRGGNSAEAGADGTPSQSVKQFWSVIKAVKASLPAVGCPALIVHAREDDICSLEKSAFVLQRRLGGLVETLVLDDSYHIVTLDRQRHLVIERSVAFLAAAAQARKRGAARRRMEVQPLAAE